MENPVVWKDIVGYEGIYEVSNTGEIRTHKNKITQSIDRPKRKWKQRILKQRINNRNRSCVTLYKNKKKMLFLVHRLVALAFIPKVEGKNNINHIDGNSLNNHVDNLEWCTYKENTNHAFGHGLIKFAHPVILINKENNEQHHFRSKAKASEFLGRRNGFLQEHMRRGKTEYKNYKIEVKTK